MEIKTHYYEGLRLMEEKLIDIDWWARNLECAEIWERGEICGQIRFASQDVLWELGLPPVQVDSFEARKRNQQKIKKPKTWAY